MKDYTNYYPTHHEKMIADSTRLFNIQLSGNEGKDGYIDDVSTRLILQKHTNTLSQFKGEYYVICNSNLDFKRGSIIKIADKNYITTFDVEYDGLVTKRGLVQECNNILKFYKDNTLYQLPCIFNNSSLNSTDNKFMSLPSGNYMIRIKSGIIDKSDLNLRFILNSGAYKVVGIDDSVNGLIDIEVKEDQFCSGDNKELGIANWEENQANVTTTVRILNGEDIILDYLNTTYQLNTEVKVNNNTLSNPIIIYSSNNINIATVSNTGLITVKSTGDCTITATYNGISDSIIVHGTNMVIPNNYNIIVSPNINKLELGRTINLVATVLNNGVVDNLKQFNWNIINKDNSSNIYATLIQNDKTCSLTASKLSKYANKYIILRVSLSNDSNVYTDYEIKIINLV